MQWLLCRTKPKQESYAQQNLRQFATHAFFPRYFCDETKEIKPLFPSYLFVHSNGQWIWLESCWGIRNVIKFGAMPAQVPEHVIQELKKQKVIHLAQRPQYYPGQKLRLTRGAFLERIGIYQSTDCHDRIHLLVKCFNRDILIKVPKSDCQAA